METIKDLNSKWWYRLSKVVYFAIMIMVLFITTAYIGNETSPYSVLDLDNSHLVCLKDNKIVNFKLSFTDVNRIEKSSVAYRVLEKDWDRDDLIGRLCNTKKDHNVAIPPINNTGSYTPVSNRTGVHWREEVLERHEIIKNDRVIGSLISTFFFIAIAWMLTFLAFEILRRTFYYIVLGSIRPKKE